jgi:flagellar hook-associated protein 1 FlgK
MRDETIPAYLQSLNDIAQNLISRVNAIHSTGVTSGGGQAGNFFSGTNAANINIMSDLASNPSLVATSTTGNAGDNTLANAIAAVQTEDLIDGLTLGDAYSSLVSIIGAQSKEASSRKELLDLSSQQLKTQRESASGVSLDEEMVNMVKFQQAYSAAARIVAVANDMLDTIINRMGVGG